MEKFPLHIKNPELQTSLSASIENKEEIRGEWIKYEQGSRDADKLFESLVGKGADWYGVTKGYSDAASQLRGGDFYVYYTNDSKGNPTQPRLAIRMDGDSKIGEVRGILPGENIEPVLQGVIDEKLKEFSTEADEYCKKSEDMKKLTLLDQKSKNGEVFTKDDLTFLYEINTSIESFGYDRDPRTAELLANRNLEEDMLVIFECTKEQIARAPSEINENIKAYVGQLEPGIFQKLPENLEHIFISFPKKKIRRDKVEIGGKTAEQLMDELELTGIYVSDEAKFILKSHEFMVGKNLEEVTLVHLTVADLGAFTFFGRYSSLRSIYEHAETLGLELCPAEVGPPLCLKYRNQPLFEPIYIGMKQITDASYPGIFNLYNNGLSSFSMRGSVWDLSCEFVFRLRKLKT